MGQDIVDETTKPSPVEVALGEILDEIYAEPVASLEPSEELKMTHQVENAFLEKLSHILPSIVNNFEKIGGSSAGGERAIVGEVRKKVTVEVEGEDDRVLIAKLQFALSFEEPKTDVAASTTASSQQPESSGHQDVEVESESTTQNPPSSSTEMSKPSEALPQPEQPLYPQEHLQHQQDPLFSYFPGGDLTTRRTKSHCASTKLPSSTTRPYSTASTWWIRPSITGPNSRGYPTKRPLSKHGVFASSTGLLPPSRPGPPASQRSGTPLGQACSPPTCSIGHPLGRTRTRSTRTRSRTRRTSSNVLPSNSLPGTQAASGSTRVGQGPLMLKLYTRITNNPKRKNMQKKF